MEFILLGQTSDDKGSQLEKLTADILKEQGYSEIYTNVVNSGASEVDIKAIFKQSFMTSVVSRNVIGECKAYSRPVSLPDWLKFLGKIFSEEISGSQVQGCFIAFSGVNGNVIGHYNSIKAKRNDIILLAGEDLNELLHSRFGLRYVSEIQAIVQTYTVEQPVNYSICYYDTRFYWLVTFKENRYTVIEGNGNVVGQENFDHLHDMIIAVSSLSTFIDLNDIKQATERSESIDKYIINSLLIENQYLSACEILDKVNSHFSSSLSNLKIEEVKVALELLETNSILSKADRRYNLRLFSDNASVDEIVLFYRFFTHKSIVLKGILSKNYGLKIDEKFLMFILNNQGGVHLSEDKFQECLKLIKWSPSALIWGLIPDENIINHRSMGSAIAAEFETQDTNYFINMIYESFSIDFKNQLLGDYFFSLGLRDIIIKSDVRILSENGEVAANLSHDRIGLAKFGEEYDNRVVPVYLLNKESPLEKK